jgi:hypothetical protein
MEIGPILGIHDLKAIGGALNGWRVSPFILTQAGHASLVADRTSQRLVPFVLHQTKMCCSGIGSNSGPVSAAGQTATGIRI